MDDSDEPSRAPAASNGADLGAGKRRPVAGHSPAQRARITNGSKLLPTVDGNSVWARILRDNLDAMIVHLGGEDHRKANRSRVRLIRHSQSRRSSLRTAKKPRRLSGAQ